MSAKTIPRDNEPIDQPIAQSKRSPRASTKRFGSNSNTLTGSEIGDEKWLACLFPGKQ